MKSVRSVGVGVTVGVVIGGILVKAGKYLMELIVASTPRNMEKARTEYRQEYYQRPELTYVQGKLDYEDDRLQLDDKHADRLHDRGA